MATRKNRKSKERKRKALGVILFLLGLLILVSLVTHDRIDDSRITGETDGHLSPFEIRFRNQAGMLGAYLSYFLLVLMGWLAFFVPFGFVLFSLRLFSSEIAERLKVNSFIIFIICLLGTLIYNIHILTARYLAAGPEPGGGIIGDRLTAVFIRLVGETGSYILLAGIILVLLILYTSITPVLSVRLPALKVSSARRLYEAILRPIRAFLRLNWLTSLFESKTADEDEDEFAEVDDEEEAEPVFDEVVEVSGKSTTEPDTKTRRRAEIKRKAERLSIPSVSYTYPTIDLLTENPGRGAAVDSDELNQTSRALRDTLETFSVGIDGGISQYPGPIITRYEFKPASGVKINQIVNLSDDLALALKAKRIRIIAPIPGKAAVGVEIPNRQAQLVYIRDILESDRFNNPDLRLPLAMGKTTSGKPYVTDLTKMPHLLIAGATGSGKSVCLNVMITSLLYRLHPHQLRLIFIDPKMLELSVYSGIPHMGRPVVTNPRRAEKVLSDAVQEMEKRYRKLAGAAVRNIVDYNRKQESDRNKLPYIVICVDELADMMMSATSSRTEMLITRLAQMSRAVGIHLILATQRPSVDVITGLIKANFPARVAFQVSSKVDSRTIIDANGAEKLLGNGDMLFLHTGQPEPLRIHGAYISSGETEDVVAFINEQGLEPMPLEGITQATGEAVEAEDVDYGDPLFKEACEVVVRHKQGSVSLLQRRLGIGYQRAARLIDKLEQAGIVSPFDGSKAREVLVDKAYLETLFSRPDHAQHSDSGKN
ncbi:MAG: DNA translocase FtsK 4TM domain-containing protein [Candidatus Zixiibacteriota bacterium]|nr:MAG: DNA translocase FtsK 4TM domain-containing protein [candidate division Zixibacteria bacterium]